jgi:starch synthase
MKILLASSEVYPYSKTGGLADMVGALAKTLARRGHEVGVVTPLYAGVRDKFPEINAFDWQMSMPLGERLVSAKVWTIDPEAHLRLYFIDHAFFQRNSLYQEHDVDYTDNAERFVFFSKAVTHIARYLPWRPELVHVHDWQAGFVPLFIRHQGEQEGWGSTPRVCLTIHNLAYQGLFPASSYGLTNLPKDYFAVSGVEFYGLVNCLKAGIVFADTITTVSPRYAREIETEDLGCGLDGLLRQRQAVLQGILNGVDYDEWNTTNNPFLKHPYSIHDMSGKAAQKADLQRELGLPVSAHTPLFGSITRLSEQKGVGIQLAALEEMLAADIQFVLLGSGAPFFENAYRRLALRFPAKVSVRIGFDQGLSHKIEAASDFFLMPSRFEPCGLNQMYSQRYGTVPVVRRTGGLDDTVIDISEDVRRASGIKFSEYSARALVKAMHKALVVYKNPALLRHYQRNAMSANFSWEKAGGNYVAVYRRSFAKKTPRKV